jgi:hypothetical protein
LFHVNITGISQRVTASEIAAYVQVEGKHASFVATTSAPQTTGLPNGTTYIIFAVGVGVGTLLVVIPMLLAVAGISVGLCRRCRRNKLRRSSFRDNNIILSTLTEGSEPVTPRGQCSCSDPDTIKCGDLGPLDLPTLQGDYPDPIYSEVKTKESNFNPPHMHPKIHSPLTLQTYRPDSSNAGASYIQPLHTEHPQNQYSNTLPPRIQNSTLPDDVSDLDFTSPASKRVLISERYATVDKGGYPIATVQNEDSFSHTEVKGDSLYTGYQEDKGLKVDGGTLEGEELLNTLPLSEELMYSTVPTTRGRLESLSSQRGAAFASPRQSPSPSTGAAALCTLVPQTTADASNNTDLRPQLLTTTAGKLSRTRPIIQDTLPATSFTSLERGSPELPSRSSPLLAGSHLQPARDNLHLNSNLPPRALPALPGRDGAGKSTNCINDGVSIPAKEETLYEGIEDQHQRSAGAHFLSEEDGDTYEVITNPRSKREARSNLHRDCSRDNFSGNTSEILTSPGGRVNAIGGSNLNSNATDLDEEDTYEILTSPRVQQLAGRKDRTAGVDFTDLDCKDVLTRNQFERSHSCKNTISKGEDTYELLTNQSSPKGLRVTGEHGKSDVGTTDLNTYEVMTKPRPHPLDVQPKLTRGQSAAGDFINPKLHQRGRGSPSRAQIQEYAQVQEYASVSQFVTCMYTDSKVSPPTKPRASSKRRRKLAFKSSSECGLRSSPKSRLSEKGEGSRLECEDEYMTMASLAVRKPVRQDAMDRQPMADIKIPPRPSRADVTPASPGDQPPYIRPGAQISEKDSI